MLNDVDREREYSPSSCVGGDISGLLQDYADRSAAARAACAAAGRPIQRLTYGPRPRQQIDLAHPSGSDPVPLIVFVHGGYWQQLSIDDSVFGAADALRRGLAYAAIGYTLAPDATLDEIVAEVRAGLGFLVDRAAELGIDPDQVVVSGSSAGAHLAAMASLADTAASRPAWRPAGMALLSGVYDLEPLIRTSINEAVGLDDAAAHRNSPLRLTLEHAPPAFITFGDNETSEFKRQSAEFHDRLLEAGGSSTLAEIPGRNHFDIILELCDDRTPLGRGVLALFDDPPSEG